MPELPDVEGYRRTVEQHALGKTMRAIEVVDPAVLRNTTAPAASAALVGRCLAATERRGKWLIARSSRAWLLFHFGMTGRLEWQRTGDDVGRFVRLCIEFADGRLVYRDPRRLRGMWLCTSAREVAEVTGPLGPDALGLSVGELDDRLRARRGVIKAALMDQQVIAGLGNMLSDEVLWRAGVHPASSYAQLSPEDRRALHRSLRSVLASSVRAGSIPRRNSWLSSQRGLPEPRCPRGHGELRTSKVRGRSALWCPRCQPQP